MSEEMEIEVIGSVEVQPNMGFRRPMGVPARRSLAPPMEGKTKAATAEEAASEAEVRQGIVAAERTLAQCILLQEELEEEDLDLNDEAGTDSHLDKLEKLREKIVMLETEIAKHKAALAAPTGQTAVVRPTLPLVPHVRFVGPTSCGWPELDVWLQNTVNKNLQHNRKYYIPTLEEAQEKIVALQRRSVRMARVARADELAVACLELTTRLVRQMRNRETVTALEEIHQVWLDKALRSTTVSADEQQWLEVDPAVSDQQLEAKLVSNHDDHVRRIQDLHSRLSALPDGGDGGDDDSDNDVEFLAETQPANFPRAPPPTLAALSVRPSFLPQPLPVFSKPLPVLPAPLSAPSPPSMIQLD